MRAIGITLRFIPILFLGLLLHYVLPQHDVVRVTSTEVIRTDFSSFNRLFYAQADSGATEQPTRDLRLINTDKKKTFLLGFIPRAAWPFSKMEWMLKSTSRPWALCWKRVKLRERSGIDEC